MEEIKIDEMTSVIDGVHDIVENNFEAPNLETSVSNKSSIGYMAIGAGAVAVGAAAWHFGKKAFKSIKQKMKDRKAKEVDSDDGDNFDDNESDKE